MAARVRGDETCPGELAKSFSGDRRDWEETASDVGETCEGTKPFIGGTVLAWGDAVEIWSGRRLTGFVGLITSDGGAGFAAVRARYPDWRMVTSGVRRGWLSPTPLEGSMLYTTDGVVTGFGMVVA